MSIVFIIFLACIILYCIHSAREVDNYNKSQYRKITKNSFWDVEFDKGKNGEYKIYKSLFRYEMDGASFCLIAICRWKTKKRPRLMQ